MAPLPPERIIPSDPFAYAGVDYAGPFNVLAAKGRGCRATKGYVAVFVCLRSKGVHLKLVGDLTTESLQAALERFTKRRGKPKEIWSDNATHFHRADREMKQALRSLNWDQVADALATEGITWKFIPPAAPHFGGLWEAGVKSFKRHLKRVAGPRNLTYEEFSTLLIGIEAVLNRRPLSPLSSDLDDLEVLTAGDLLVGRHLGSIPEVPTDYGNLDHLTHWKLVKAMRDELWKRWSREYLNTLQQRQRWLRQRPNLKVGDLVFILDPSLLRVNGRWPLGRVIQVHPGPDGNVRTVTVRAATGEYVRPIVKLALIPLADPARPNGSRR